MKKRSRDNNVYMVLFVGRFKVFRGCQAIVAQRSEDVLCDKSSISAFPSLIPPPPPLPVPISVSVHHSFAHTN